MEFDDNGYLDHTIDHFYDLDLLKENFVDHDLFKDSRKRREIFDNFVYIINDLISRKYLQSVTKMFVDGSFCTKKRNPSDVDFIIFVDSKAENRKEIIDYIGTRKFEYDKKYSCDCTALIDFDFDKDFANNPRRVKAEQQHQKFIVNTLKYDRKNNKKGFITLTF